jgi:hypothetical protein
MVADASDVERRPAGASALKLIAALALVLVGCHDPRDCSRASALADSLEVLTGPGLSDRESVCVSSRTGCELTIRELGLTRNDRLLQTLQSTMIEDGWESGASGGDPSSPAWSESQKTLNGGLVLTDTSAIFRRNRTTMGVKLSESRFEGGLLSRRVTIERNGRFCRSSLVE